MMAPMVGQKKNLYEILGVARDANSLDIGLAFSEGHSDRVQAACEFAIAEVFESPRSHAGHNFHIDGRVSRIGQLHAKLRDR